MKKVVNFENEKQFQAYIKQKTCAELGEGSEGVCLLGKDGKAYKDFTVGFMADEYLVDDVVTIEDTDVESFVFPDTLFAIDNNVLGYKSKCVHKDDLDYKYLFMNGLDHINFDRLIAAYGIMYNDALVLANQGIRIFDLSYNVMFDGDRLYGIDTCGYRKIGRDEDVTEHNTACVDKAIKDLFSTYVSCVHNEELDTQMKVIPFLTMVEQNYTSGHKGNNPQYSKH